ncbi:nucleotidyltransferase family protein, partial [Achromobacter kerstersii]|uniref:nucleotidyltransferase family protein n=1 Tax=Achromobacter kerstersii TaxID=1353890 RepID=UPI001FDEA7F1
MMAGKTTLLECPLLDLAPGCFGHFSMARQPATVGHERAADDSGYAVSTYKQPEILVPGEMMTNVRAGYEQQLCDLVESSEQLMAALRAVRCLGLPSWCIGAGAIRSLVWDSLHGFQEPSNLDDVDVAYFDAEAPLALDAELQERLHWLLPSLTWEVTNQARVHEWFAEALGRAVSPLTSLEDGLATWPEFATCVG